MTDLTPTRLFSSEQIDAQAVPDSALSRYWKILIVDDEPGIHEVTELTLGGSTILDQRLTFLHAYNSAEAIDLMSQHSDIAVVLLDVVMEKEDAGLEVAMRIRDQLNNQRVRIILRTGQPGQAPERFVIEQYDINDYKEKTELTSKKLYSCVYTALRCYRDIIALERSRAGLEKVIHASACILEKKSLHSFAEGTLEQLTALMHMDGEMWVAEHNELLAEETEDHLQILACSQPQPPSIPPRLRMRIQKVLQEETDLEDDEHLIHYIKTHCGTKAVLCLTGRLNKLPLDRHLLDLYSHNVAIAFDNLRLNDSLICTQKEIVYALCELAETRSKETGNHVRRVAHYAKLMATELGLDSQQQDDLFLASPLHDIGKIGIPDAVLNKPGRFDDSDWEIMKTHTLLGAQVMQGSKQPVLQAGSIIAEQHHENWDGSGYPYGLAGERIHIYGQISAMADVFDALVSKRCYKPSWELTEVNEFILAQSGQKFSPELCHIYQRCQDGFVDILQRFRD